MKKDIRKIKVLIIFAATCGVLVFCGVVTYALLRGRIPPKGYGRHTPILHISHFSDDSTGRGEANVSIIEQFPELNSSYKANNGIQFMYKEQVYYVEPERKGLTHEFNNYYTVFQDDRSELGSFIKPLIEYEGVNWYCGTTFLDDNYLYYSYRKHMLGKETLGFGEWTFIVRKQFYRYEFYRFDLETGENESIGVELMFEKLCKIHDNIGPQNVEFKINPKYRGQGY